MAATSIAETTALRRTTGVAGGEFLTAALGPEAYGIDILRVQEIRSFERPTRVANAPPHVLGVLNLRGTIVPIVDLRGRLGLECRFDAATVTVVLTVGGRTIGAVVDSVSDVIGLTAEQIKPPPEFGGALSATYITGLAVLEQDRRQRVVTLLDIESLVADAGMN